MDIKQDFVELEKKEPTMIFDIEKIRKDFPILLQNINGKLLVYLDNAATTQKPLSVINAISNYYLTINANIHRGIHTLSEELLKPLI